MAEMVGSCVVQEMVSRAISRVLGEPEGKDKAALASATERLEMAHSGLELALERSGKLPITDASLLRQRGMFKRAHEECGHVLHKHKLRIIQAADDDEEAAKNGRLTPSSSSSPASFARKIIHTVKSYLLGPAADEPSYSGGTSVGRFEWFADKAARFVRDLETGCSLSHNRFLNPLLTQLLRGKTLRHETVRGSRRCQVFVEPAHCGEHGVVASLWFRSRDGEAPARGFSLALMLRLSESTDIAGIVAGCLSSLGPRFRSAAQLVAGELARIPAAPARETRGAAGVPMNLSVSVGLYRPDPLCCRENSRHAATRAASPELTRGFLEQVILMSFHCYVPAASAAPDPYGDATGSVVVTDWPPLQLSVFFTPHCFQEDDDTGSSHVLRTVGGREEGTCYSLHQTWEMARAKAVEFFVCRPEVEEYEMLWESLHGFASLVFERHGVPRIPGPGGVAKTRY